MVINLASNPHPGELCLCIYVPQRQGDSHPKAPVFLSVAFYDTQGYGGGIVNHLHIRSFSGTNKTNSVACSPQENYTVTCWVYVTRQVTSRRIQYSEFIPHSLLHSHNLQSYNYLHRQYHNCLSCSHCHSLDTTMDFNSLRRMLPSNSL
jgi:hypothetical protein